MAENYVYPTEKRINMVAYASPVNKNHKTDKKYDEIIDTHIDRLNQQSEIFLRDKNSLAHELQENMKKKEPVVYDGQRVYRLFNSLNNSRAQESLDLFRSFTKENSYYVFDIETFGDTQDHFLPFGVSEISINEYDKHGNPVREVYNGVARQDDDVIQHFRKRLSELKKDKYLFNGLPEWEKRSIVDFMRFSDKGEQPFFIGSPTKEMNHNSIIHSVFDHKDQMDTGKFVREFDSMYADHVEAGINNISKIGDTQAVALQKIFGVMDDNPDKIFISYNGNSFDMKQLEAMAESQNKKNPKLNLQMPEKVKHLDYLNVIRTVFNDPDELKKLMNNTYDPMTDSYSKEKLASYVKSVLGISENGFHNAKVDVDNTAKLVAAATTHIENKLYRTHTGGIKEGFNHLPTEMTWNEEELTHGQKLFAKGGVQVFREGDESFKVALNDEGKWVKQSNGFNKTVLNSKSFYDFAGHIYGEEAEKLLGDAKKQAFVFYNPDADDYSYIVRKGEHAFNELQDFVHKRFYNWDGVPKQLQRDAVHIGNADRARRQYERYFSMDGAGSGLRFENGKLVERGTSGFVGLKRMLENAEIMRQHIESGKDYKAKVMALQMQGLTKNQAKEAIRNPLDAYNLVDRMDFTSKWNPTTGKYEFNKEEKDKFFKFFGRLIDEAPYLQQAVTAIEKEFAEEIDTATKITNRDQRNEELRKINQRRDFSLMRYHQYMTENAGEPTKLRPIMPFESHQLSFFDPERGADSTLDFSSSPQARDSIYNYVKRGIDKGDQNHQELMKQRLEKLVQTLHGQNIIDNDQLDVYRGYLDTDNTAYHAAASIATDMRAKNGGLYQTGREEPVLNENKKIQSIKGINRSFIQRALEDTQNSMMVIEAGNVKTNQLRLQNEWKDVFDILDEKRFSGLQARNFDAVRDLVNSIQSHDSSLHIALTMSGDITDDANLKVYAFKPGDSAQVINQLGRNQAPTQAIEFQMPLVNEGGYHRIGNRRLIGHSYAELDGNKIKEISSAQYIARGYDENMNRIIASFHKNGAERATLLAKRRLNDQVMQMSGASPLTGVNDSMDAAFNQMDMNKESTIKIANAMVEDLFYNGYDGIKLEVNDFKEGADVLIHTAEGPRLRRGLTFEDLQTNHMTSIHLKMQKWAKERVDGLGLDLYTDSVKDGKVIEGTLNKQSAVDYRTYGTFDNYGRDNATQNFNAHQLDDTVFEDLRGIKGVTTDRSFITEKQLAYEEKVGGNRSAFNGRMAVISQDQFRARINQMLEDPTHQSMLKDIGIIGENGVDHLAIARVYEQQMAVSSDVADALKVHAKKTYDGGAKFETSKRLSVNKLVMPGDFLGTRIHESGKREEVKYEGHAPARIIAGLDDGKPLELQWEHDAFKLMVESEKGTISHMNQQFINAFTGRDDIIGFMNPDVGKHGDYRLLMSGEARYMAEELKGMTPADRKSALEVIDRNNLGLKWDEGNQRFLDDSQDVQIHKDQFNKTFAELKEANLMDAPVLDNGIRFGSYEIKVAKVENYHKAVDHTGRRVIGWKTVGGADQPIYANSRGQDGVKWAHREMGIFKDLGMKETYNHVYQEMLNNNGKAIEQVDNLVKALDYTIGLNSTVDALDLEKFKDLPDELKSGRTYQGTVFDHNKVKSLVAEYSEKHGRLFNAMNEHGFYVNLPSVIGEDGNLQKVTLNVDGGSDGGKAIDKMFIPFTHMQESPDGETHLRELQQHIGRIYQKADEITNAPDASAARHSFKELNRAVNDFMDFSINKELSSSKGTMLGEAFSTRMHTSASGLFKLMDAETSLNFGEGEHVVINPETARKMGIHQQLLDAAANDKKIFTAAVRYPSFHKGAIQFAQLHMSDSVKEGEFHTSTFASMLQAADSDGDNDHIVVVNDKDVQAEWEQKHDNVQREFENRYQKYKDTEHPKHKLQSQLGVNLSNAVQTEDGIIPKNLDPEEALKSKIGKAGIGMASNLGLTMRQVANGYMKDDKAGLHAVQEFTRGLEQKIISSKHGASPTAGRDLISAISKGKWDLAREIDNLNYDGLFQKDFYMDEVAEKFPIALQNTTHGLKSPARRFGMGNGADPAMGISKFLDLLEGRADIAEYSGDNTGLALYQHRPGKKEMFPLEGREAPPVEPFPRLQNTPMAKVAEETDKLKRTVSRARNVASDAIGGTVTNLGGKVSQLWGSIKGMSGKQKAFAAGGLAVAGVAGYNILNDEKPEMRYMDENKLPSGGNQVNPREPVPALSMPYDMPQTHNASISISASGGGVPKDQLSQMVTQGMTDSGMNAGPTRVSVTHTDNTNQLNRQWYRDRVQENI